MDAYMSVVPDELPIQSPGGIQGKAAAAALMPGISRPGSIAEGQWLIDAGWAAAYESRLFPNNNKRRY